LSNLKVGSLSAISANLGSITAGSISINNGTASIASDGAAIFRSIKIQDANGTTILESGGNIDNTRVNPAAGWLNDNVRSGGVNLVGNSGFLKNNGTLPTNWGTYNNLGISVTTSVQSGGLFGQNYFRVTTNAATTSTMGIYVTPGSSDSVKTWEPGQTYCISFWAKGSAGAVGKYMNGFNSNMGFTSQVTLENPQLTNTWQRYVFRGIPASNVQTPLGELYLSWDQNGTLASGSVIDITCPKVELGTQPTSWTPSPQDTLNQNISVDGSTGQLTGIGTGSGTTVANNQISVNASGQLAGVGGTLTTVANNQISVDSSGNLQGIGTGDGQSVANNVDSVIRAPAGALYVTSAGTITGAIKIRLPQLFTDTMMRFTVEIYEYNAGFMCTLEIGGYNYDTDDSWYNVSARVIGSSNVEYPVYFGHDGTKCCVWIGVYNEQWSYPQVRVRDFFAGYSNYSRTMWQSGWQISFDTTQITSGTGSNQYSAVVTDTYPAADWSKTARRPSNLSSLNGTESIQNTQITIDGNGAVQGIATANNGTTVANNQISVNASGQLAGVGGTLTTVANTQISIDGSGNVQGINSSSNGTSVANNVASRINLPVGGTYTTTTQTLNGALKVRLPARVNVDSPMVKFTVEIYEYISNRSCILALSGHTSGTGWYNVTANVVGGNTEYPVYFGHDGTYFVVWIGDTTETWSYPQVFVTDILVGFQSTQASLWASNWSITFDTAARTNVTQTVTDTYPGADWSKTARRPTNLASLTGGENILNTLLEPSINTAATTALWTGVSGEGRPQDNATVGATAGSNLRDSNGTVVSDTRLLGNLVNSSTWVLGSSGNQTGFFQNPTSSGGLNYIEPSTTPDGTRSIVWVARSGNAEGTNAEGGWDGVPVNIDHTKMYRFSVWIKNLGTVTGNYYLGVGGSTVRTITGGVDGNPYFMSQNKTALEYDVWYLVVGFVFPSGYSGAQYNLSGTYRSTDGVKVYSGTDYRWVVGQTTSFLRTYQYYTTVANCYQLFWNPRLEMLDGTEPSIAELLSMGSISGRNKVTESNNDRFLADNSIPGLKVSSIRVGTINSSVNGGATAGRVEIDATLGGRIRVYDTNGAIRVRIGYLL
jgi:hypothetical protein